MSERLIFQGQQKLGSDNSTWMQIVVVLEENKALVGKIKGKKCNLVIRFWHKGNLLFFQLQDYMHV